jgi:lipase maturation factor 1
MEPAPNILVASPPARPVLLYDGDCGFCRLVVARWRDAWAVRIEVMPAQSVGIRFPEIPRDALARAVHLVTPDGRVASGAAAVLKTQALCGRWRPGWWLYRHAPGFAPVAEAGYRLVARHRGAMSLVTRALWGRDVSRPTFHIGCDLFLRLLGLTYFVAFASLGVQVAGLAGDGGIQPVARLLEAARSQGAGFGRLPTLCLWLGGSDAALHGLCIAGALCGLLLMAGILPSLSAAAAWVLYLSLCAPIEPFMSFQWDALLLEAGLIAIFLPPHVLRLRFRQPAAPSRLARFLLVWLLIRIMFSSGVVKLASNDAAWWNLTALTYHYWTQPLPPWTAWYFDKMPLAAHRACCFIMFAIELAVPFLLFLPRRLRHFGGASILALMAVIMASGNYGFFNLLTGFLCIPLFDDHAWRRLKGFLRIETPRPAGHVTRALRWAAAPALWLLFWLTWVPFGRVVEAAQAIAGARAPWRPPRPPALYALYRQAAPFRSVNHYGLFAVMTKSRDEITLQGSDDGVAWKDYAFRWKPGDAIRRPRFCVGHMPRLDWQMWFAALGDVRGNPWLVNAMERLLEGQPDALDLLAENPFPDKPPRYVRATAQAYRFTTRDERRSTGAWWRIEGEPRIYCPPMEIRPRNFH